MPEHATRRDGAERSQTGSNAAVAAVETPRVELWLREPASPGVEDRQVAIYDRLRSLERDGRIGRLDVSVWGRYLRPPGAADGLAADGDGLGGGLWRTYSEFEAWAERNDHELAPAFRRRRLPSLVASEVEVVVLPVACLAVRDGDDLAAVVPCSTADGVVTVEDGLDSLGVAPDRAIAAADDSQRTETPPG